MHVGPLRSSINLPLNITQLWYCRAGICIYSILFYSIPMYYRYREGGKDKEISLLVCHANDATGILLAITTLLLTNANHC